MGYSAMLRSGHHGQVMLKNKNETRDRTKRFFCVFVFRPREVGPLNPEKRSLKGGDPKSRKMELQRMGPRRVEGPKFRFFFPLPPKFSKRAHLRVKALQHHQNFT